MTKIRQILINLPWFNSILLLLPHLSWHNNVLKKPIVPQQSLMPKTMTVRVILNKSTKRRRVHVVTSTTGANNIQRRGGGVIIYQSRRLFLLVVLMWQHKVWGTKRTGVSEAAGFGHKAEASPCRSRARVPVLPFVGCNNDGRVVGGTLHALLNAATRAGATVVAPTWWGGTTVSVSRKEES